jgi:hypothetical protein
MSLVSTSTAAYYGFTYDLNGNITKQQDKVQGFDSTNFTYDTLDRVTLCTQTEANDVSFATSHYDYDLNSNIQDTYRDELCAVIEAKRQGGDTHEKAEVPEEVATARRQGYRRVLLIVRK